MRSRCRQCKNELDASNTHCPFCLRSRPSAEIVDEAPRARGGGRKLAVGAAIVAAALIALALMSPERPEPEQDPVPPAAAEAEPPPTPAPQTGPTVTVLSEQRSSPAPTPRSRPAAERRSVWKVAGRVYDLHSLKPVAGARLVFQDKASGAAVATRSGRDGRYRASLPKVAEGGYEVSVSHREFRDVYLEEMSPPYRSQSRARRLQASEELAGSALLHVPLLPPKGARDVTYDVILFPRQ